MTHQTVTRVQTSTGEPQEDGSGKAEGLSVLSVDTFNNGIALGKHRHHPAQTFNKVFALGLGAEVGGDLLPMRARYTLHRQAVKENFTTYLKRLRERQILSESVLVMGAATDPFLPFEGKFETSMQSLEAIKQYPPGRLLIQTRSPLLVIALPVLKALGSNCTVTVPIETPLEEMVRRYTPSLPGFEERLKLIRALRSFGVDVHVQMGPLLPYGDWQRDAEAFLDQIAEHANHITVLPLMAEGRGARRTKLESGVLGQKLARDKQFHWLRTDATRHVEELLKSKYVEKAASPTWLGRLKRQIDMFAA
jgi:DNA repair photolyase